MPRRNDITDEMVVDLYFNKGLNRRQTAEKLKCSEDLIAYRVNKLGLSPKPMAECVFAGKKRSVVVSEKLGEILTGELLGDGSLNRHYKQGDFRESVGHDKKEWAEYLMNIFINNNIPIMGKGLYKRKSCGKSKNYTWSFSTLNTIELGQLHKKWYVKNESFDKSKGANFGNRKYVKIIPVTLKLTPKALLHWYIGDGTTNGHGCSIYTQGFKREEIEFLRFKLKNIGLGSSYCKNGFIYIPKRERIKLLEIIGGCPVECYEYKWKIHNYQHKKLSKYNNHIDMKMVEEYVKCRRKFEGAERIRQRQMS